MNFLAHIYLSGDSDQLKLGNFIGDYVKGRDYMKYPEEIKKGILLHRKIDTYTDSPNIESIQKSKRRLRPIYGKYAGVVIDIFYDHFLSANWNRYSKVTLDNYSSDFYRLLRKNIFKLPFAVQKFVPFLIKNRRLQSYGTIDGIKTVLDIMHKYSGIPDCSVEAVKCLEEHYDEFKQEFLEFFDGLQKYVDGELGEK